MIASSISNWLNMADSCKIWLQSFSVRFDIKYLYLRELRGQQIDQEYVCLALGPTKRGEYVESSSRKRTYERKKALQLTFWNAIIVLVLRAPSTQCWVTFFEYVYRHFIIQQLLQLKIEEVYMRTSILSAKISSNQKCPQCKSMIKSTFTLSERYNECQSLIKIAAAKQLQKLEESQIYFQQCISDILGIKIGQAELQYSSLRQQAKQLMRLGKYSLAATILMTAFQNYFDIADAEEFLGLGSMHQAFCTQLEICLDNWNRHGDNLSLLDELAICFSTGCFYQEGVRWYHKMHTRHSRNYKFLFSMGILKQNHRFFREAKHQFDQAQKISSFPKISLMKAFIYKQMENDKLLRKYVELATQSNPKSCATQFLKLQLQLINDRTNQCERIEQLQIQYPGYIEALLQLAFSHRFLGNYTKSIQLFQKCSKRFRYNQFVNIQLGISYAFNNECSRALQYLIIETCEGNERRYSTIDCSLICQFRGYCFAKLGQYHQASYWLDEKARQFSNSLAYPSLINALMQSLFQIKKYYRIAEIGANYLNCSSNYCCSERIYRIWLISSFKIQKYQLADLIAKRGCKLLKNGFCYELLGDLFYIQNKLEQALKYYTLCKEEGLERFQNAMRSADVLERLEKYQESIEILEKCYELTTLEDQKTCIQNKLKQVRNRSASKILME